MDCKEKGKGIIAIYLVEPSDIKKHTAEGFEMKRKYGKFQRVITKLTKSRM